MLNHRHCSDNQLTPRERVELALAHQDTDRVPVDFWAVPEVWAKLKAHFGVGTDEEVLQRLGSDCRMVAPPYVGPPPPTFPDGSYLNVWRTHRRLVKNRYSAYEEYAGYPLASARSARDVLDFEWPMPEWWDVDALPAIARTYRKPVEYHTRYEVGGIFELAWGLRGYEQFMMDLATNPEIAWAIMEKITDIYIANVRRVLTAAPGLIDMVYTYDDVAGQDGLLISPAMWREYIRPHHVRLNAAIKEFGVKIMYHSCGAVLPLVEDLIETGIDVLNPLQPRAAGMDMSHLKNVFGRRISFHGAIDIQETLPRGTTDDVRAEVRDRIRVLADGGGYILASAHYLQGDTPVESILAMYDEAGSLASA